MKYIQLKYKGNGKRTVDIHSHGFMGPSKSPMGNGPLNVNGEFLRPGSLTTAFQLDIPPSGECQVVDCQHNREMLRKVTKLRKKWEEFTVFDQESGKHITKRENIEYPPAFEVIDGTNIKNDIVFDTKLDDSKEVKELKDKIAELESQKSSQRAEAKSPHNIKKPDTTKAQNKIPIEDDDDGPESISSEQLKKNRFANKVTPV